jgi:phosphodiesterase/alkaline phosphatase D-like protein
MRARAVVLAVALAAVANAALAVIPPLAQGRVAAHARPAIASVPGGVRLASAGPLELARPFAEESITELETRPATSITQTTATLNANVNPHGVRVVQCEFLYGEGTSISEPVERTECAQSPGSGNQPVHVSAAIAGLSPGTTYWFDIDTVNEDEDPIGEVLTFTTVPEAPAVVTDEASQVAPTSATLNGTVNPEGGNVTECYFFFRAVEEEESSTAQCSSLPGSGRSSVPVSAEIESLKPGTTYVYELRASYGGDATGSGRPREFTTPAGKLPTVVTKEATAVGQTTATFNGTVNPNGQNVETCVFDYGTTENYGSSAPCTTSPGSGDEPVEVSATVSLSANTTYHYRIFARNASGPKAGADETFKTLAGNPPPTVVTGVASSVTQSAATLNATVNPNGGEVTSCRLQYGTTASYGSAASCSPAPGSGTSAVAVAAAIGGLSANTTYHFRIAAKNAAGESVGSDQTFKTLAAPPPPTVVTGAASSITQTGATLNATVNPNGEEVTSCRLQYGTTTSYGSVASCSPSPGSGTSAVAVAAAIGSLSANTTYHFRIAAKNAAGEGVGTDQTFKTLVAKPPTVVTGAASSITQASATLNATVNPNGGEVTSCALQYGTTTSYGSVASCSPSPGSGTSAVAVAGAIGSLSANTTYHFRIAAKNAAGENVGADQTFKTLANPEAAISLLAPGASNQQVGKSFSDTAVVTEHGAPVAGVPVTFTVTGANPQTATINTNSAGEATFAYTGSNAGSDHIVASFRSRGEETVISNEVTEAWTASSSGGGSTGGGSTAGAAGTGSGGTGGVLPSKEGLLPPPVLGKTVNAELVSGTVFVKLPGGAQESLASPMSMGGAFESLSKGLGFIPLIQARQIPVGSILETTHGVVKLTAATATAGKFGFGDFGAGIFKLLQNRKQRGLTELWIMDSHSPKQVCATVGKRASVASKHLSSTVLGRLTSSDHGKFTARGQYSAATVRGTVYSVTNECAGTLTQVSRGVVGVRDFARRKTIILRAGQHYLAKAP